MEKKLFIGIVGLIMFAAIIGTAKAEIKASIEVKDSSGNALNGLTVPINTVAYAYGYYVDSNGAKALATLTVYYDDGAGFKYKATLFVGIVKSGDTVMGQPFPLTEIGDYEFRWTCLRLVWGGSAGMQCVQERAQARTRIQLITPEPGTLAGLTMALSALGLLVVKRKHLRNK